MEKVVVCTFNRRWWEREVYHAYVHSWICCVAMVFLNSRSRRVMDSTLAGIVDTFKESKCW